MKNSAVALRARNEPPDNGTASTEPGTGGGSGQNSPPLKLTRRGHTKSRRGCLTCKQRRVKCPEDRPACNHCVRLGLTCDYLLQNAMNPTAPLQSTGGQFSLKDLRLFHHFILHAYPPLPLQGKAAWDEIATVSHCFEFLVHSMLGLAASHLSLSGGGDHQTEALAHRVKAIKLLNQALSTPPISKTESDARFSTLLVLTFQSSYMPEGMLEVFHMIRGCMIVSKSPMPKFALSLSDKFVAEGVDEKSNTIKEDRANCLPQTSLFLSNASNSLKALQHLCQTDFEKTYYSIVKNLVAMASVSNMDTLLAISSAYNIFREPDQAVFNQFMNSENYVAQLLVAHFFLLEYVIGLKVLWPYMSAFPFRATMTHSWIKGLAVKLPSEYVTYLDWPLEMLDFLDVLYLDLPEIPNLRISD